MKNTLASTGIVVLVIGASVAHAADIGTAFTYQGHLENGSGPLTATCDFRVGLWDAAAGGSQVGASPQTENAVDVVGGVFTVSLNFGAGVNNGTARWLEIEVQCPGDAGFTLLSPRVELTPAPHALALPGLYTQENATSPNIIGGYSGNSVTAGAIGATIAGGGRADDGIAALDYHRVTDSYGTVGGGWGNQAGNGSGPQDDTRYATVGGGAANTADGESATISGGVSNTASGDASFVGGGAGNTASHGSSTVAGGEENTASHHHSTVSGGSANTASHIFSTVAGGDTNIASGDSSTVGGGWANTASGGFATVPGGNLNKAGGGYSLAAGRRAIVRDAAMVGDSDGDNGTFIWADSTNADFTSTGPNQFLIRAGGGVGIGTNSPTDPLTVNGIVRSMTGGFELPDGTILDAASDLGAGDITAVNAGTGLTGGGTSGSVSLSVSYAGNGAANTSSRSDHYHSTLAASDGSPTDAIVVDSNGYVGIGAAPVPFQALTITGDVEINSNSISFDPVNDRLGIGTGSPVRNLDVVGSAGIGGVFWVNSGSADVGIGTPSPSATLEVVGSLKVDTNTLYVNNSTDRVGIGTTGPGEKLTVVGVVESTSGGFKFPDDTTQTTACPTIVSASVAVNPPSISAGSNTTISVTVTGAAVGDAVIANPGANLTASYAIQYVRVSAANTVTIGLFNPGSVAVDPASTTWEFRVIK